MTTPVVPVDVPHKPVDWAGFIKRETRVRAWLLFVFVVVIGNSLVGIMLLLAPWEHPGDFWAGLPIFLVVVIMYTSGAVGWFCGRQEERERQCVKN